MRTFELFELTVDRGSPRKLPPATLTARDVPAFIGTIDECEQFATDDDYAILANFFPYIFYRGEDREAGRDASWLISLPTDDDRDLQAFRTRDPDDWLYLLVEHVRGAIVTIIRERVGGSVFVSEMVELRKLARVFAAQLASSSVLEAVPATRDDAGNHTFSSAARRFVEIDGRFYDVAWIKSAPGLPRELLRPVASSQTQLDLATIAESLLAFLERYDPSREE